MPCTVCVSIWRSVALNAGGRHDAFAHGGGGLPCLVVLPQPPTLHAAVSLCFVLVSTPWQLELDCLGAVWSTTADWPYTHPRDAVEDGAGATPYLVQDGVKGPPHGRHSLLQLPHPAGVQENTTTARNPTALVGHRGTTLGTCVSGSAPCMALPNWSCTAPVAQQHRVYGMRHLYGTLTEHILSLNKGRKLGLGATFSAWACVAHKSTASQGRAPNSCGCWRRWGGAG